MVVITDILDFQFGLKFGLKLERLVFEFDQLQLTLPQPDMVTFLTMEGSASVSVSLSKLTDFKCWAKPASMVAAC
jgi:hypothetical protein